MAIARVQFGKADASGSGATIACTVNGIAVASLVVVNTSVDNTPTISSVKDDLLVTAALATGTPVNVTAINQRGDQRYFENYGGGSRTFTATFSAASTFRAIIATEYSGAETSGVFDTGISATGTSAAPSSTALTPALDGSLFVGFCVPQNAPTFAAPFSNVWTDASVGANTEDYVQPTIASQAATWTQTSGAYGALVGVYKPSTAPAIPPPRLARMMSPQQRMAA